LWLAKALLRQGFFLASLLGAGLLSAAPSLEQLAEDPYWLRLLRTEAEQPLAMLDTTLAAFASQAPLGNQHALCLFPARAHWLREKRPDLAALWPSVSCPEYESWLRDLKPDRVTLVYASDFAGNPSSLFGHTLLRIDSEHQQNDLLAYAINFSANSGGVGGLSYALAGMTGRFPGSFSLLTYYDKVREYNDLESRDLWQYELNLTPAEAKHMARVYWDWRQQKTAYYFLRENCSYELLGLLDATRPSLNLQARFTGAVIPTDTVREIVSAGLVKQVSWRASANTRLQTQVSRNSQAVNQAVVEMLSTRTLAPLQTLAPIEQAQALELAHDEQYRRFNRDQRSDYGPWFRKLLMARNRVPIAEQRPQPPTPNTRPEQSHRTARAGVGFQQSSQGESVLLHFRPAYHDVLDDPAGYRPGSRVSVLETTLRLDVTPTGKQRVGLERFTLLAVDTFTPVDALATPLSWTAFLGAEPVLSEGDSPRWHTQTSFNASAGLTTALNSTNYCHGQLAWVNRYEAGHGLDSRVGPRLGCFGQWPALALQWQVDSRYLAGAGRASRETELGLQWGINRDHALRLQWQQSERDARRDRLSLSWLRYF
jgi:hypothetical protein